MITVLAKFCLVKIQDFGAKCFEELKHLLMNEGLLGEKVEGVIVDEIINKIMKDVDLHDLDVDLLEALVGLIEETEKPTILTGLYEGSFTSWV